MGNTDIAGNAMRHLKRDKHSEAIVFHAIVLRGEFKQLS